MTSKTDQNKQIKLQAVRQLQRLLHLIDSHDFSGTVELIVYADGGVASKIRSRVDQFERLE